MWGIEAEQDEVIVNAYRGPQSVFTTQLANEQTHLFVNGRPSAFSGLPSPEESEASPVPLHDGRRLHYVSGFPPVRPESIKECPEEAEGREELRSRVFPLLNAMFEYGELALGSEKSCCQTQSRG